MIFYCAITYYSEKRNVKRFEFCIDHPSIVSTIFPVKLSILLLIRNTCTRVELLEHKTVYTILVRFTIYALILKLFCLNVRVTHASSEDNCFTEIRVISVISRTVEHKTNALTLPTVPPQCLALTSELLTVVARAVPLRMPSGKCPNARLRR